MRVSIRELKARLSHYLRRVQRGEEVVITHRGRPLGRIVPADEQEALPESEVTRRLRALSWIRAGAPAVQIRENNLLPYRAGEKALSEIVSEERG